MEKIHHSVKVMGIPGIIPFCQGVSDLISRKHIQSFQVVFFMIL
jgi:hypothetical protein